MIIGLAGHVDHGKSALVAALTGGVTDRLAEERRRGMTIALGYAFAPGLTFIDVPGHERFIATMAAGAAGIDAALLVVAADDGVMVQTVEHAAILAHLGIPGGVVAITKSDLAPGRVAAVSAEVAALLASSGLGPFPMVAVSTHDGTGLAALSAALRALPPRPRARAGRARLSLDRAFTLNGVGLVVTGTLMSGRITVGDAVMLSPSGLAARVRGLHAEHRPAEAAAAGQRVALNLAGPGLSAARLRRGDFVLDPALHHPTEALDVRLFRFAAPGAGAESAVHVHLAAAQVRARLLPATGDLARLLPERPLAALAGDRFVLRDAAARRTLGGGVVLDPFPPRRGRLEPRRLAFLGALARAAPGEELAALLALPPGWVDLAGFARAHGLTPAEAAGRAQAIGAVRHGAFAVAPKTDAGLIGATLAALAAAHRSDPEAAGLAQAALRQALPDAPPTPLLAALLGDLVAETRLLRRGGVVLLPDHRPRIAPDAARLAAALRPLLAADALRPPRLRDLCAPLGQAEGPLRLLLRRLARAGEVVELAPDRFYLPESAARLTEIAADLAAASADGAIDTAAFRDRAGLGRKLAIEILEGYDRAGLTARRSGRRHFAADPLRPAR